MKTYRVTLPGLPQLNSLEIEAKTAMGAYNKSCNELMTLVINAWAKGIYEGRELDYVVEVPKTAKGGR